MSNRDTSTAASSSGSSPSYSFWGGPADGPEDGPVDGSAAPSMGSSTADTASAAWSSQLVQPVGGGEDLPFEEHVHRARLALPADLPKRAEEVLLALDIDGTLLAGHDASDEVREAIALAREAGINVVIATGRSLPETRPALREIGYDAGYMISSNGARTVMWEKTRDGRSVYHPLREWKFEPVATVERLKRIMPEVVFGVDQEDGPMLVSSRFAAGELVAGQRVTDLHEMVSQPTTRMIVREENLSRDQFASRIGDANLDDVEVAVGWTSWADVTAKGCTKGRGLTDLTADLGIPSTGTVAIGDGENDIAMLRWANHGVAMGNAGRVVQEAADAVAGSVRADGAAAVIRALVEKY